MTMIRAMRVPTLLVLLAGCCAMFATACERRGSQSDQRSLGFIAVVGVGQDDPVWPVIAATAKRTFAQLNQVGLSLRVEAPATSSIHGQQRLLTQLRDAGVRGLCVQVTDPVAMKPILESLADQGIQITTMVERIETSKPINHVSIDDSAVGEAVANALLEALPEGGNVALLHSASAVESQVRRRKAFERRMSLQSDLRVLLEYDCGGDAEMAEQIVRETMQRYPRLAGWAVLGSWPLEAGTDEPPLVSETCRLVGVGPGPVIGGRIDDGWAHSMVVVHYDRLVGQAITECVGSVLNMNRATTRSRIGARVVTRETLDAFRRDWAAWTSESADSEK